MQNDDTSWREDITELLTQNGETWADVEAHTLTDEQLDKKFDHGYGGTEGAPFTLWTKNNVYFPGCYDGAEWVASVPRNPNGHATEHVGGG
jgi:hypothetical protein